MFWVTLLIIHGLLAFLLLGAVTHQGISVLWAQPRKRKFIESFASIRSPLYANAIVILFLATFIMGSWIYTNYRYNARIVIEDLGIEGPVGLFELKEHMLSVGIFILPTYWLFWRKVPIDKLRGARVATTLVLAVAVWGAFIIGHIVNNAQGL